MERLANRLVQEGRIVRAFLSVDHRFETTSTYPVQHLVSNNLSGYQHSDLSMPRGHAAGCEIVKMDESHFEIFRQLHRVQDQIMSYLAGGRRLALPSWVDIPYDAAGRRALYRASVKTKMPWRWRSGFAQRVPVRVTNKSDLVWPPSRESGLALMAMEVNLVGQVVDRFLGYAEWEDPIRPGQTKTVDIEITVPGRPRALILHLTAVDQGVADFPARTGGFYPRVLG